MGTVKGNSIGFRPAKKKGRLVEVQYQKWEEGPDGLPTLVTKTKNVRLHKNVPEGCSAPRRICIKCLKNHIRKNDKNYESKICKECTTGLDHT